MKVMLVSPLPPPSGGMARWTQLYLTECTKQGIEVNVVNTSLSEKRSKHKNRSFSFVDELSRTFRIVKDFRSCVVSFHPDIIHICSPCSRYGLFRDYICVVLARKLPVIFHCHCNIEDQAFTRLSKCILRRIVLKSKRIIVLNNSSKNVIDKMQENKAILIPNFIEDRMVSAYHVISPFIKRLLYVGHVKIKKGISEIFFVANVYKDIEFVIVGPVQELPDDMEQPRNVIFTGEVTHDNLSLYYEQADAFIFPSHTEGFANVMLEAMASGLPIVSTDVGANRDMIEEKGGIIIPPKNREAFVSAIAQLESPDLRMKMSVWNINKVRSNYTLSRVIQIIKRLYEEEV